MVEVQCETDFVARNEDFQAFAYDIALHIAAMSPRYVGAGGHPRGRAAPPSASVFEEKAKAEGKPDNVVEKIVDGQLAQVGQGAAPLLEQEHVNADKHDGKTIEELRRGRGQDRRERPDRALLPLRGRRARSVAAA